MKHLDITTMPAPANQTIKKVNSVGLCLGASTISVVMVEGEKDGNGLNNLKNKQIINYAVHYHNGDPKQTLKSVLTQLEKKSFDTIATTGRKLRKHVNLPSISEPEAVEYAYKFVKPPDIACPAIVSAGGETFMVYALDSSDKISNVYTGNKCASGTGEFFLQQLRRMDVTLEEAAQWMDVTTPYHVSGRCSVFCKSDCTHATNKGIPKPSVTAGLCRMMSGKILELLGRIEKRNIMITGGTALNRMMIAYLRQEISGLIVPDEAPYFEALGAALWAMEKGTPSVPVLSSLFKSNYSAFNTLVPLRNFTDMVTFKTVETAQIKVTGRNALAELESSPEKTAVVVFGRPYNAFAGEANMGIPSKFASRGITLIPMDFLPLEREHADSHMYWGMGQIILKAAKFVERHPQLFGTYITNFSCGPDSFLISNFREIMGKKPSLTLELDSHTADAGLETRIEAFLDIVTAYRQLMATSTTRRKQTFLPARTVLNNGKTNIVTSSGDILPITDPRVTLLLPSMGKLSTESFAAVFRGVGINAVSLPPSDETVLKLGRANTTCKECLPLQLTTGSLLNHIQINGSKNSILVYFMPTASGPCRFGQYFHYIQNLIKRLEIPDVALFSLSCENSYMGMKKDFHLKAWCAIIVSDVMEDIRSMILANAIDVPGALDIYDRQWKHILKEIEKWNYHSFEKILAQTATRLHCIDLKNPVNTVPTISLAGEIFVRRDAISRQYLTERLAEKGFAVVCAPVSEWLVYSDYMFRIGLSDTTMSFFEKLKFPVTSYLQSRYEKRIKTSLASSGLVSPVPLDVKSILNTAAPYISKNLTGEAALTVGSAISEVASHTCGVIAIGPFGCMPNRLSEAILNRTMNRTCKLASDPQNGQLVDTLENMDALPFLAIESDGNPFPQLIEAKLEAFCLRAKRLHERMMQNEILF